MKSSTVIAEDFARFVREEVNVEGVHPSISLIKLGTHLPWNLQCWNIQQRIHRWMRRADAFDLFHHVPTCKLHIEMPLPPVSIKEHNSRHPWHLDREEGVVFRRRQKGNLEYLETISGVSWDCATSSISSLHPSTLHLAGSSWLIAFQRSSSMLSPTSQFEHREFEVDDTGLLTMMVLELRGSSVRTPTQILKAVQFLWRKICNLSQV